MNAALRVVAIDGPAGSGKSTVAKGVARTLGFRHLNTGLMYRALTWFLLEEGIPLDDPEGVARGLGRFDLAIGEGDTVLVGGKEVSSLLRLPRVEARVSELSALSRARRRMVELQRSEAFKGPLVAEGRDMTSVVFPEAKWRFFLHASPEERANRRLRDFEAQGRVVAFAEVLSEINERDRFDSTRKDSPLVLVEGVTLVPTDDLDAGEVIAFIVDRVRGGMV